MSAWETALVLDSYRPASEDRAAVVEVPFGRVLVIADGVGGRPGGGEAAEFAVRSVCEWAATLSRLPDPLEVAAQLRRIDAAMAKGPGGGETTAVVAVVSAEGIAGAAVGDSACWRIGTEGYDDLTRGRPAKPWLGSGMAMPRPFHFAGEPGTVLLATDGLWKYADGEQLRVIARGDDLQAAARALVERVRGSYSGKLPDDLAVILARHRKPE